MFGERVALLVGLFLVPGLLLALGHRLRRRQPWQRRVFWGGITGHSLALLVTLAASLYPPIWWAGGSFWRDAAVHWSLLFGSLLGAGIGLLLASRGGDGANTSSWPRQVSSSRGPGPPAAGASVEERLSR